MKKIMVAVAIVIAFGFTQNIRAAKWLTISTVTPKDVHDFVAGKRSKKSLKPHEHTPKLFKGMSIYPQRVCIKFQDGKYLVMTEENRLEIGETTPQDPNTHFRLFRSKKFGSNKKLIYLMSLAAGGRFLTAQKDNIELIDDYGTTTKRAQFKFILVNKTEKAYDIVSPIGDMRAREKYLCVGENGTFLSLKPRKDAPISQRTFFIEEIDNKPSGFKEMPVENLPKKVSYVAMQKKAVDDPVTIVRVRKGIAGHTGSIYEYSNGAWKWLKATKGKLRDVMRVLEFKYVSVGSDGSKWATTKKGISYEWLPDWEDAWTQNWKSRGFFKEDKSNMQSIAAHDRENVWAVSRKRKHFLAKPTYNIVKYDPEKDEWKKYETFSETNAGHQKFLSAGIDTDILWMTSAWGALHNANPDEVVWEERARGFASVSAADTTHVATISPTYELYLWNNGKQKFIYTGNVFKVAEIAENGRIRAISVKERGQRDRLYERQPTKEPVEEPPVEEPPVEEPVPEEPPVEKPPVEEPPVEEPEEPAPVIPTPIPTPEEPPVEEPVPEEPTREEPTPEEPTVDEPALYEEPPVEEPPAEEPIIEEPAPEEPLIGVLKRKPRPTPKPIKVKRKLVNPIPELMAALSKRPTPMAKALRKAKREMTLEVMKHFIDRGELLDPLETVVDDFAIKAETYKGISNELEEFAESTRAKLNTLITRKDLTQEEVEELMEKLKKHAERARELFKQAARRARRRR